MTQQDSEQSERDYLIEFEHHLDQSTCLNAYKKSGSNALLRQTQELQPRIPFLQLHFAEKEVSM